MASHHAEPSDSSFESLCEMGLLLLGFKNNSATRPDYARDTLVLKLNSCLFWGSHFVIKIASVVQGILPSSPCVCALMWIGLSVYYPSNHERRCPRKQVGKQLNHR